jgi:hypothetical protein
LAELEPARDLFFRSPYFHVDDGHGIGASHQTGWTAMVLARMLTQLSSYRDG